jgi:hypothetical protein
MPSEPEFASIPGTPTSGCPSRPPSAQPEQPLSGCTTERVQDGVQTRNVVALRREVHVAVGMVESERRRVQLAIEEVHDDVHRAEARAEMPEPRA